MNTPRAIVTDIEGTTSSIAFVHDVLFPYARRALPGYLQRHHSEPGVASLLDDVRREAGIPDAGVDRLIATLVVWIDEDRKSTPLKALQGLVWKAGYRRGDFTGHVYPDAAARLKAWHDAGIPLYVYSSGSVQAQQLLFGYSDAGDLRPLFAGYFDTGIGHKREVASYRAISNAIGVPAPAILFLSDVVDELDAAREAGMSTTQLVREDNRASDRHVLARDFTSIVF